MGRRALSLKQAGRVAPFLVPEALGQEPEVRKEKRNVPSLNAAGRVPHREGAVFAERVLVCSPRIGCRSFSASRVEGSTSSGWRASRARGALG